jgi:hypothetical protein
MGGPGSLASTLDILHRPAQPEDMPAEAVFGAGSIHHIAFGSQLMKCNWNTVSVARGGYEVNPSGPSTSTRSAIVNQAAFCSGSLLRTRFAIDEPAKNRQILSPNGLNHSKVIERLFHLEP